MINVLAGYMWTYVIAHFRMENVEQIGRVRCEIMTLSRVCERLSFLAGYWLNWQFSLQTGNTGTTLNIGDGPNSMVCMHKIQVLFLALILSNRGVKGLWLCRISAYQISE